MAIYELTLPDDFKVPSGHAQRSAFVKGAMAWKDGKPLQANPYEPDQAPIFYRAWHQGWSGANEGIIKVKVKEGAAR